MCENSSEPFCEYYDEDPLLPIYNSLEEGIVGWLVDCFGFNGPLRQYFSQKGQMRVKMSKPPPPAPTASAVGLCPTVIKIVGRPEEGIETSEEVKILLEGVEEKLLAKNNPH